MNGLFTYEHNIIAILDELKDKISPYLAFDFFPKKILLSVKFNLFLFVR